jgi:hypothetical protein
MARMELTREGYECQRCSHQWVPQRNRDEPPIVCPKRKSPYWHRPRREMKDGAR